MQKNISQAKDLRFVKKLICSKTANLYLKKA